MNEITDIIVYNDHGEKIAGTGPEFTGEEISVKWDNDKQCMIVAKDKWDSPRPSFEEEFITEPRPTE